MNTEGNFVHLVSKTGSLHFELQGDLLLMDHTDTRGREITVYKLPMADFLAKLHAPYVHFNDLIAKLYEAITPLPPWPESWPE